MRLLCDVHRLPYLSVTSPTIEITNINYTVFVVESLMNQDIYLKATLMNNSAPRLCMEVVFTHAQRLRLLTAQTMDPLQPLGVHNQSGMK